MLWKFSLTSYYFPRNMYYFQQMTFNTLKSNTLKLEVIIRTTTCSTSGDTGKESSYKAQGWRQHETRKKAQWSHLRVFIYLGWYKFVLNFINSILGIFHHSLYYYYVKMYSEIICTQLRTFDLIQCLSKQYNARKKYCAGFFIFIIWWPYSISIFICILLSPFY